MEEPRFMTAEEVAKELQSSKGYAYKVIKEMNEKLEKEGYLVVRGKIPRKYFLERCYGGMQS